MNQNIKTLIERGVRIPNPQSVEIGDDIDPERISARGVIIHTGCKIMGSDTMIGPGSVIGQEAPATVVNCQIGADVRLKGGFFKEAVFLKGAQMASGAHVREGCILEEGASGAHTVAIKQTILFPFVTLGSLINFCDCLISGGTGPKNHSEVGSSYIHFNFTPNQDKATPSLLGDVPRGVMLNQKPIFLGGQGGLAGPCRINFGNTIAAGSIYRKDFHKEGYLLLDSNPRSGHMPFPLGLYRSIKRIVTNNIYYIANLMALKQWYLIIRERFIGDDFPSQLQKALIQKVHMGLTERIARLKQLADKMPQSIAIYRQTHGENVSERVIRQKEQFHQNFDTLESLLHQYVNDGDVKAAPELLLSAVDDRIQVWGQDYIAVVQHFDNEIAHAGSVWLQTIVDEVNNSALNVLPGLS
jgi:UDP-N-acetylglucosamine/UDP-N-acetylgalactosamine diphosphorylase